MTDSPIATQFIDGYKGHEGGSNGTILRVVIHGTVSQCYPGQADNTANYFTSPNSGGLAHYVVDPSKCDQCCPEDLWCWHAPPNPGSIGIELTDPVAGQPTRWSDAQHVPMLKKAAALVADICKRHNIPIVKLSSQDLIDGKMGICGHVDVSNAWHQSDHSDPGPDFPWDWFINEVKAASGDTGDFTVSEADRVIAAVNAAAAQVRNDILTMLEGQRNPDGSIKDPTHTSLRSLEDEIKKIEKKEGI